MRLRGDTEIHGTAAPLGCQVRRLRLNRGDCRGFRDVRLWAHGCQRANLVLARPVGIGATEPWYLVSNAEPSLDLVWSYERLFCCEQLFRDQKFGIFRLESSDLRESGRIDRLLLVVAIAVLGAAQIPDRRLQPARIGRLPPLVVLQNEAAQLLTDRMGAHRGGGRRGVRHEQAAILAAEAWFPIAP